MVEHGAGREDGPSDGHRPVDQATPMVVGDRPAAADTGPESPSSPRRTLWITLVVLAAAAVATLLLRGDGQGATDLPQAPVGRVQVRWSVPVESGSAGSTTPRPSGDDRSAEPSLVLDGDRLVVVTTGEDGVVLQHRSATTGEPGWKRSLPAEALPVLVDGGRALAPGRLGGAGNQRRLVGISIADGTTTWDVPIGADFNGHVTTRGEVLVSGNGQCGALDPGSGRFLDLQVAETCSLRDTHTARRTVDGWVVRDLARRDVATIASDTAPVLAGTTVVGTRGDEVVLADDGDEHRVEVGEPVQWLAPVGDDHVTAWTERAQYVVDVAAASVDDPMPTAMVPVAVDGRVLVFDDGRSPVDPLVASGVWSRSPDANRVRVLDDGGTVLAERELVLDAQSLLTQDGVLLWDRVDGDRHRLGLYGLEDLAPRWQVDVDGFPVLAPASSPDAVVLVRLDADGELVVTGLG